MYEPNDHNRLWPIHGGRAWARAGDRPKGDPMSSDDTINAGLFVTLWPEMPHFYRFKFDPRIRGIRLNPAMLTVAEVAGELQSLPAGEVGAPLYFDVKGRQLRVEEILPAKDHLRLRLNHPISVDLPTTVLFKAGNDRSRLDRLEDGGRVLVFAPGANYGPEYKVKPGESLHIRHPSMRVNDTKLFSDIELQKIKCARHYGIKRWFLSYVEAQSDVDRLRALVGETDEIMLKIESKRGMQFVREKYTPQPNVRLVAACGDMYVELDEPQHTLTALQDIIAADPNAIAASRMMLTITQNVRRFGLDRPDLADFAHLAWLGSIGYRTFMLCDEICLESELLDPAVAAFDAWSKL